MLDTDIGYDPDDVLALLTLARYCQRRHYPLAIVTSAETPGNNRARAVHWVLRSAGLQDVVSVIAAGQSCECPPRDRRRPGEPTRICPVRHAHEEPFACGLKAAIEAADIPVGAPDVPAGGAGGERYGDLADIGRFIAEQHAPTDGDGAGDGAARARVTWIGIGPMTNLAAALTSNDLVPPAADPPSRLPDDILQMGSAIPVAGECEGETNIRLDAAAAVAAIAAAANLGIPLTLVTLDTTGYGLHLLDEVDERSRLWPASPDDDDVLTCRFRPAGVGIPPGNARPPRVAAGLRELLWQRVPGAAAALAASTRCAHYPLGVPCAQRYSGNSSLHDPLTVLLAIDIASEGDGELVPLRIMIADGAIQICRTTGIVMQLHADAAAVAARRALAVAGEVVAPHFWGAGGDGSMFNHPAPPLPATAAAAVAAAAAADAARGEAPPPVSRVRISLGPLTGAEVAQVHARLGELLQGTAAEGGPDADLLPARAPAPGR